MNEAVKRIIKGEKNRFHYYGNEPISFFVVFLKEILKNCYWNCCCQSTYFVIFFKTKVSERLFLLGGLC